LTNLANAINDTGGTNSVAGTYDSTAADANITAAIPSGNILTLTALSTTVATENALVVTNPIATGGTFTLPA
jgi:hypothetical protein